MKSIMKTICIVLTAGFAASALAEHDYGRTWSADRHRFGNCFYETLAATKPRVNVRGTFDRLEHREVNAVQFCRQRGMRLQSWRQAKARSKKNRWNWTGAGWSHSKGRNYIGRIRCMSDQLVCE